MPNQIDASGLLTKTQAELVSEFTAAMQSIYGNDIDLSQSSPDGQQMMIIVQEILDLLDLITQIYNFFDPDNAIGNILDQRVAINGIQRQGGTFTLTNITIVTSASCTLYGLDQNTNPVYTVQDNAGNQFQLITTIAISGAGTQALAFQAKDPGAVLTIPNTITIPVTIVLGVTSVNNPTTYTVLGINEETDAQLKIRRQQSVAIGSQGYHDGLVAALKNLNGVTDAFVYENVTSSTDGDGIPGHSIWVIVAGSASNGLISGAIYQKRNAGCGMKGSQSVGINQADGSTIFIKWDFVVPEDLYIKFTATSLDGTNPPAVAQIRSKLVDLFVPRVNEEVNINRLATDVQEIDDNTLVTSAGFSTSSGGSYTNTLTPATKNKQIAVSEANIIILPIFVTPNTAVSVAPLGTKQFTADGGYGTYTWTIHTNNSGGSINSSTGLYTAGSTGSVTDVVRVTDGLSNFTDVNVAVS